MSSDLFKTIDVNVLQEEYSDRYCTREISKRLHHNDVIDSHLKQSEDSLSPNNSLLKNSYSTDPSYSADDEDSDIETVQKLKKDSAEKSNVPNSAAEPSVVKFHVKFHESSSSSDTSPSNHGRFVKKRKICESAKPKILASHSRKSVSKTVSLLPSEQLINSLVLRVSAIKLCSDSLHSYKGNDEEMDVTCPSVPKKRKTRNKITKRKYDPRHSLRKQSVLKTRV